MKSSLNRYIWRATAAIFGAAAALTLPVWATLGYRHYKSETAKPIAQIAYTKECGVYPEPAYVRALVSLIYDDSKKELGSRGIDVERNPTLQELDEMKIDALPYVASVLEHSKVQNPNTRIIPDGNLTAPKGWVAGARYNTFSGTLDIVEGVAGMSLSKDTVAHELIHAQYLSGNMLDLLEPYIGVSNWFFGIPRNMPRFFDETFAAVAAKEVLAMQALNGDTLARNALGGWGIDSLHYAIFGKQDPMGVKYYTKPAGIFADALSCRADDYRGVRFDGIRTLMERENKKFRDVILPSQKTKRK